MTSMSTIAVPDLARRISATLGVRGLVNIDTVAPELVPVLIAGDMTEDARWRIATGAAFVGAVAGQRSGCWIANPGPDPLNHPQEPSSNTLIEVTAFNVYQSSSAGVVLAYYHAHHLLELFGGASANFKNWADFREPSRKPVAQLAAVNAVTSFAGTGRAIGAWSQPVATTTPSPDHQAKWILTPGWGISIEHSIANTDFGVCIQWRERPLEPSEPTAMSVNRQ